AEEVLIPVPGLFGGLRNFRRGNRGRRGLRVGLRGFLALLLEHAVELLRGIPTAFAARGNGHGPRLAGAVLAAQTAVVLEDELAGEGRLDAVLLREADDVVHELLRRAVQP